MHCISMVTVIGSAACMWPTQSQWDLATPGNAVREKAWFFPGWTWSYGDTESGGSASSLPGAEWGHFGGPEIMTISVEEPQDRGKLSPDDTEPWIQPHLKSMLLLGFQQGNGLPLRPLELHSCVSWGGKDEAGVLWAGSASDTLRIPDMPADLR